jgi:glucose-6-phosphate isomerase
MSQTTIIENNKPTSVLFDILTGQIEPCSVFDPRHISDLADSFCDAGAVQQAIECGNPLVYEIRHTHFVTRNSDMATGVSTIMPGKIGGEYFMTKGHVHERDDQPEIYYCVRGSGLLLMDDMQADFIAAPFQVGTIVHIPPQYAHRVVNTGADVLIFVSTFHLAAGHNYAPVKQKGFEYMVVEKASQPELVKNPRRIAFNQEA